VVEAFQLVKLVDVFYICTFVLLVVEEEGAPSLCKYKGWWGFLDSSGRSCRFWRATCKV